MAAAWIDYSFKVALFLAAGYFFYHALLRNDAHFLGNRLFLLSMLPVSFLLPLAPLRSPFRSLTVSPEALASAAAIPEMEAPAAWTFASVLAVLYWAGAAILLLRILFHLFHLFRLKRRHPREKRHGITLVRVAAPIPPFSFFNSIFLHAAQDAAPGELKQIISHEAVHIRQLHSLDILVMELAVALQWFNPAVWLCRKALKETHEYLADREVIAQGFNAEGYRLLLFEQQLGARLFEFASHLKQSQIKRRIFMMTRMKRTGKAPYKVLLALPLAALLALVLAQPRLVLAGGADEPKAQSEQELKETQLKLKEKEMQLKLEEKEMALKEKLTAASDAAEKEKLALELEDLHKKRQALMADREEKLKETLLKLDEKEKHLKELYAAADSAEKKEKIKQDLEMFYKKRQAILEKYGVAKTANPSREELEKKLQYVQETRLKIKQLLAGEKDPGKIEQLKAKLEDMAQFEEELKIKLEEKSQE